MKTIKKFFENAVKQAIGSNLDHYQRELATARHEIYRLQNMVAYMLAHTPTNKETAKDWEKIKNGDFTPVGYEMLKRAGFVKDFSNDADIMLQQLRDNAGI